jgi:hypothetical protein
MPDPTRNPLAWPAGWPRTAGNMKKRSSFSSHGRDITLSAAMQRLEAELDRLGASEPLLSSNLKLGISGVILSGQAEPRDNGISSYFKLLGHDRVLACDRYLSAAANIAAIAAHIDALRRIDRYGVGTIEQAFAGYTALEAPGPNNRAAWRETLGFKHDATVTTADVQINYRSLAKHAATDEHRLKLLNLARDAALAELGA